MASEAQVLKTLRSLCLPLPEASETRSFGHPTFKAGRKTLCVLERYGGRLTVALPVGHDAQRALLTDTRRFQRTPYVGQHGWVSLIVDGPLDKELLAGLVRQAYEQVALRRMLAKLAERGG